MLHLHFSFLGGFDDHFGISPGIECLLTCLCDFNIELLKVVTSPDEDFRGSEQDAFQCSVCFAPQLHAAVELQVPGSMYRRRRRASDEVQTGVLKQEDGNPNRR